MSDVPFFELDGKYGFIYKTRSLVQLCFLEAVLGGCAKRRTSIVNKRCWVCIQISNGLHTKKHSFAKVARFFFSFIRAVNLE